MKLHSRRFHSSLWQDIPEKVNWTTTIQWNTLDINYYYDGDAIVGDDGGDGGDAIVGDVDDIIDNVVVLMVNTHYHSPFSTEKDCN